MATRKPSPTRRREAARRDTLKEKEILDAERRRKDEQETDYGIDFRIYKAEREDARNAVDNAEIAMGRAVHGLIGDLGIAYTRASKLLAEKPDELKRLRKLATDATEPGGADTSATANDPVSARVGEQGSSLGNSRNQPAVA
jgi:hypothetical protein